MSSATRMRAARQADAALSVFGAASERSSSRSRRTSFLFRNLRGSCRDHGEGSFRKRVSWRASTGGLIRCRAYRF